MRRLLAHQVLSSVLNVLLPYAIIFIGDVDWHSEYSRLFVYILFARSLMYNSYTSIFTESTNSYSDNKLLKFSVVIIIAIFISLISKGLFNNPVYLISLVTAMLFEDFRRKELFYGKTFVLNIAVVLTFSFFLFAGSSPILLLILSAIWLVLSLRKTNFDGATLKLTELKKRWSYILMAIFAFASGGVYLDRAALVLNPDEFQDFRYILFIFAPISFICQLAEYLWFSKVYNRSRKLLLSVSFIINIISILSTASVIYSMFHPQFALLVVIVINAILISANSLLRIVLRSIRAYNFLFLVVVLGSIPCFFMWVLLPTSPLYIYTFMAVGLCLMFILLLIRTINLYGVNRSFENFKIG